MDETGAGGANRGGEIHRFFESAIAPLWIADAEGRLLHVNAEWERVLGYRREEVRGRRLLDLVHPDDLAAAAEALEDLARRSDVRNFVNRFRCADGTFRSLQWRATLKDGLAFATGCDVTEAVLAQSALRESEDLLRQIIELVPQYIFAKDENSRYLLVNRRVADLFGAQASEVIGKSDGDFSVTADEASRFHEDDLEVIRGGKPKIIPDERITDACGRVHRLEAIKIPFRYGPARVPAVLGVATDVTEIRDAQDRLAKSEAQYRLLAETAQDVILLHDMRGRITYANPATCRLSGYSEEELLSLDFLEAILPEYRDAERERMARRLSGDAGAFRYETEVTAKDGRKVVLEVDSTGIVEGGRLTQVLAVARDVTEIRRLEDRVRQSQKMEAIGQLAGGIAHDFNNLLQVITGYLELAMAAAPPGRPPRPELEQVAAAAARAVALVRQLLTFGRRETMRRESLDVGRVIADTAKMLRRVIGEDIRLETVTGAPLPMAYADPGHVEQILVNLCVNARDAMPEGGSLRIETAPARLDARFVEEFPWTHEGEYVLLAVSDTGSGMPPEVLEHVFEPFFTTKETGKGTGLGLATIYGIVRQHEGLVRVESEFGRGTTVRIYLPVSREAEPTPREAPAARPATPGGGETILIAEDEDAVRDLVAEILQGSGYRVLTARDGEEAVEIFDRTWREIDLVVMDAIMPRRSGRAAYDVMRAADPTVRVLFCSGYSFESLESASFPEGTPDVLAKPFSPAALLERVREILDRP